MPDLPGSAAAARLGWFQPLKVWRPARDTIALVCDPRFPADDATRLLGAVAAARPEAVWVVRETDKRARSLLSQSGIDPVLAPLVGYWKNDRIDLRARWRDLELIRTCELVLVARDRRSQASLWWKTRAEGGVYRNIRIAER